LTGEIRGEGGKQADKRVKKKKLRKRNDPVNKRVTKVEAGTNKKFECSGRKQQ